MRIEFTASRETLLTSYYPSAWRQWFWLVVLALAWGAVLSAAFWSLGLPLGGAWAAVAAILALWMALRRRKQVDAEKLAVTDQRVCAEINPQGFTKTWLGSTSVRYHWSLVRCVDNRHAGVAFGLLGGAQILVLPSAAIGSREDQQRLVDEARQFIEGAHRQRREIVDEAARCSGLPPRTDVGQQQFLFRRPEQARAEYSEPSGGLKIEVIAGPCFLGLALLLEGVPRTICSAVAFVILMGVPVSIWGWLSRWKSFDRISRLEFVALTDKGVLLGNGQRDVFVQWPAVQSISRSGKQADFVDIDGIILMSLPLSVFASPADVIQFLATADEFVVGSADAHRRERRRPDVLGPAGTHEARQTASCDGPSWKHLQLRTIEDVGEQSSPKLGCLSSVLFTLALASPTVWWPPARHWWWATLIMLAAVAGGLIWFGVRYGNALDRWKKRVYIPKLEAAGVDFQRLARELDVTFPGYNPVMPMATRQKLRVVEAAEQELKKRREPVSSPSDEG